MAKTNAAPLLRLDYNPKLMRMKAEVLRAQADFYSAASAIAEAEGADDASYLKLAKRLDAQQAAALNTARHLDMSADMLDSLDVTKKFGAAS
ncbi:MULTISPECIES: hypothetical protein [Bradyrhizobium]|jgi:hypothetical protein|uniref:hypothetical protein n=1 Tax=Bradyrhizobium TaxID=374 RepID=UPI00039DAA09|nr:hypothetical protein [Bradyrhizobium denitrificans]MCL8489358.1 hypothetical protein [Bradyrhizobium denitrificans]